MSDLFDYTMHRVTPKVDAPPKTGWPAPELMQDDHRGLFRWFASKPDARRQVREALGCTLPGMCSHSPACGDRLCPGHPCNTERVFWLEPAQEEETSKWPEWFVIGCIAVAFLGAAFLPA